MEVNDNHVLLLDGYNLLHRARSGFTAGDHAVAFNFFRSLRALIEQFKPTRVIMGLEGSAEARYNLFPDYKANRVIEKGTVKHDQMVDFHRQKGEILDLMQNHIPVSLVKHPRFECDDTLANIIRRSSTITNFTLVSSDSDFTQLLNDHVNVKLYNPVKKAYVEWDKSVNYVAYKALKGDATDNIPGLLGYGEKKAMKVASDEREFFKLFNDDVVGQQLRTNLQLVKFHVWNDEEMEEMTSSSPTRDWDLVRSKLEEWEFKSMLVDKAWNKFVKTFDPLFGK